MHCGRAGRLVQALGVNMPQSNSRDSQPLLVWLQAAFGFMCLVAATYVMYQYLPAYLATPSLGPERTGLRIGVLVGLLVAVVGFRCVRAAFMRFRRSN